MTLGVSRTAIRSLDDGKTWIDRQMIFKGYCGALIDIIQTRSGGRSAPPQSEEVATSTTV